MMGEILLRVVSLQRTQGVPSHCSCLLALSTPHGGGAYTKYEGKVLVSNLKVLFLGECVRAEPAWWRGSLSRQRLSEWQAERQGTEVPLRSCPLTFLCVLQFRVSVLQNKMSCGILSSASDRKLSVVSH